MKYKFIILIVLLTLIVLSAISGCNTKSESNLTIDTQEEEIVISQPVDVEVEVTTSDVESAEMVEIIEEDPLDIYEYVTEEELIMLAQLIWGESRGIPSTMEKSAVVWSVLNRVDASGYANEDTVAEVITFPYQYSGYDEDYPVEEEFYNLSVDVVTRWVREKNGELEIGRTLPPDYLWFLGDYATNPGDHHNYFRNQYKDYDESNIWDWSYPNPYND